MTRRTVITRSADDTRALAASLLAGLPGKTVFALYGELGSGKTCFVQGLARAMGISRAVTSPTFTIAREYPGPRPLFHLDLYRIRDSAEAVNMGFEDYASGPGVAAVEWAERAEDILPRNTVRIRFSPGASESERVVTIEYEKADFPGPAD